MTPGDPPEGGPRDLVLHVEAENRLEEIDRVVTAFGAFADEGGLSPEVRRQVKLVLDELLNNVIRHGYEDDERHLIEVSFELSSERVTLRIADDGRPFDPLLRSPPDVTQGIDDREVGGLGIHLVRRMMDEVSYDRSDERNVTVLVKYLVPGES